MRSLHFHSKRVSVTLATIQVAAVVILIQQTRRALDIVSPFKRISVDANKSQPHWTGLKDTSLARTLLPPLRKSISDDEKRMLQVAVYIVFDFGDPFWEQESLRESLRANTDWLLIHYVAVHNSGRIPHNEGCRIAFQQGADYIVRVNDDTGFHGQSWISAAIKTFQGYSPHNLGVVGPVCEEGNTEILTHDMVHRTHLQIFEDYYPREFDNWWLDDWISSVYGESHTTRLKEWVVTHHVDIHGQRYLENSTQKLLLPKILIRSKQKIIDYLTSSNHEATCNTTHLSEEVKIL